MVVPSPSSRCCRCSSRPNSSWSSILKLAKAIGLDVPLHLQQLADEGIEQQFAA